MTVAVVGDAGVQFLGQLRQVAEGEQRFDFCRFGIPSGEDYASSGDVAIVVAPDDADAAVRLFHSNRAGCSHDSVLLFFFEIAHRPIAVFEPEAGDIHSVRAAIEMLVA